MAVLTALLYILGVTVSAWQLHTHFYADRVILLNSAYSPFYMADIVILLNCAYSPILYTTFHQLYFDVSLIFYEVLDFKQAAFIVFAWGRYICILVLLIWGLGGSSYSHICSRGITRGSVKLGSFHLASPWRRSVIATETSETFLLYIISFNHQCNVICIFKYFLNVSY